MIQQAKKRSTQVVKPASPEVIKAEMTNPGDVSIIDPNNPFLDKEINNPGTEEQDDQNKNIFNLELKVNQSQNLNDNPILEIEKQHSKEAPSEVNPENISTDKFDTCSSYLTGNQTRISNFLS